MPFNAQHAELSYHLFGVEDSRGREIGAWIRTEEISFRESTSQWGYYLIKPGSYFSVKMQATRGEVAYGASQPTHYYETKEERDSAIAAYLKSAHKRATAKYLSLSVDKA